MALYPTAFRRLGLSTGNKAPSAAAHDLRARMESRSSFPRHALGYHGDPSPIVHRAPLAMFRTIALLSTQNFQTGMTDSRKKNVKLIYCFYLNFIFRETLFFFSTSWNASLAFLLLNAKRRWNSLWKYRSKVNKKAILLTGLWKNCANSLLNKINSFRE